MTDKIIKLYKQSYDENTSVMRAYCESKDFGKAREIFTENNIITYGEFSNVQNIAVFRIDPKSWSSAENLAQAEIISESSLKNYLQQVVAASPTESLEKISDLMSPSTTPQISIGS